MRLDGLRKCVIISNMLGQRIQEVYIIELLSSVMFSVKIMSLSFLPRRHVLLQISYVHNVHDHKGLVQ